MICILLSIFDNTFIGTLFAGVILACFGLCLYRYQKQIDIKYEEQRVIRESASLLFANIEIASKYYEGRLNMYDGKDPQTELLKSVWDKLNEKFNSHFENESDRQFNNSSKKITSISDDLIAQLKIHSPKYDSKIKVIVEKIPIIILYLSSSMILKNSEIDEIASFRKGFTEASCEIKEVLQELIKQTP